ncbi:MAG: synthase subunit a [Crocinitomicaceae bacterium]|jgi:F-type H+-transporting ATPase subunit a|nr:synthase subunit a [Crocinitomicaceae bacterium]
MVIKSTVKSITLAFMFLLCLTPLWANETHGESSENHEKKEFNVNEMIMHHIKDAHEWHLWGPDHGGTSIYLPIILIDGGLKTFSSSHFYHGEHKSAVDHKTHEEVSYVAGVGPATGYAMYHEKIYKLENGGLSFEDGHVHGAVKPFDMSITKNVVSLFVGAILILLIMGSVARFYKKNGAVAPKGIAKFLEPIVVMVRDNIAKENIDHHKYHKFVPYLLTIFFFIFINNLLGMIPFFPGGANLTGNITVTMVLAIFTLLITVFSGNKNYWKHIFATPGVPVALLPIMIPIEVVGILTKPFALMIRLFANMSAGHIIILALISIIFINQNAAWGALSVPMALFISVLELLVAFLQAFLFALLSALFIGAAVEEAHH